MNKLCARLTALASFLETLWMTRRGRSREAFLRAQQRRLKQWLKHDARRVAACATLPEDLLAFPVTDKAQVVASFERFNIAGLDVAAVRAGIARDRRCGPWIVGASTGTSGNRGYFVIDESERFRWLGAMLAKALPDVWRRKWRVAILLPTATPLYDSANESGWLQLMFFDLSDGMESWRSALEGFAPHVLVAPPRVLRLLAEADARLEPVRLFSAAETLDPGDRLVIERRFGVQLGQIYMATEGLLGVSCATGSLHLAEDSVHFEFEATDEDDVVKPVITCFRRTAQIVTRYRMNDLLRLDPAPCACGSPLRVVREIIGRLDDAFRLRSDAQEIVVTPDILRNAILDASPMIDDFRLDQTGANRIRLTLPDDLDPEALTQARRALEVLLAKRGAVPVIEANMERRAGPAFALDGGRKLRRVRVLSGVAR